MLIKVQRSYLERFMLTTAEFLATKLGYYIPFAVASAALASVGQGVLSTLTPSSSVGKWIGYQAVVGFGRGLGLQMTFIAIQNSLPSLMVSIATSLLTFIQILGGTVILVWVRSFSPPASEAPSLYMPRALARPKSLLLVQVDSVRPFLTCRCCLAY